MKIVSKLDVIARLLFKLDLAKKCAHMRSSFKDGRKQLLAHFFDDKTVYTSFYFEGRREIENRAFLAAILGNIWGPCWAQAEKKQTSANGAHVSGPLEAVLDWVNGFIAHGSTCSQPGRSARRSKAKL